MRGERLGWFRLASHLCVPVGELQQRISSTEFSEWMEFLEEEVNDFHREDYYLAQIAAEVRRSNVKDPNSVSVKDMLLEFEREEEPSPANMELRAQESRMYWFSKAGVKPKENGNG